MIEDLEPFPDDPQPGDVCTPSTHWTLPDPHLPDSLFTTIPARIEEVDTARGVERVAYLGSGFTTMVPDHVPGRGDTTLTGALMWDRYLWMDYATTPHGTVRVDERISLARRMVPARRFVSGWTELQHTGPVSLHRGRLPVEHGVVGYVLAVTLWGPDPPVQQPS
ncbi:hypothetical protein DW322_07305 [Rhodococcus rhodnii]|nr:hypothetical protein DW322_07305 [Rhodococcus rhodnii]